jgi:hypothetical protein
LSESTKESAMIRLARFGSLFLAACIALPAFAAKSLVVDLSKSTVYAFDDGRLVRSLVINPGSRDTPTRPGHYRISQKVRKGYRSNLVNMHNKPLRHGELGAPMDYWMRLGGTGMGFHRSSLWRPSGHWGSHGCLRMSRAGARWLFDWAPEGTAVTVRTSGTDLASAETGSSRDDSGEGGRSRRRVHVASRVRRERVHIASRRPTAPSASGPAKPATATSGPVVAIAGEAVKSGPARPEPTAHPASDKGASHPATSVPPSGSARSPKPDPSPDSAKERKPERTVKPESEPAVARVKSVKDEPVAEPGKKD